MHAYTCTIGCLVGRLLASHISLVTLLCNSDTFTRYIFMHTMNWYHELPKGCDITCSGKSISYTTCGTRHDLRKITKKTHTWTNPSTYVTQRCQGMCTRSAWLAYNFLKVVWSFCEIYRWLNNFETRIDPLNSTCMSSNKPEHTVSTVKQKHYTQGIPEYFYLHVNMGNLLKGNQNHHACIRSSLTS